MSPFRKYFFYDTSSSINEEKHRQNRNKLNDHITKTMMIMQNITMRPKHRPNACINTGG